MLEVAIAGTASVLPGPPIPTTAIAAEAYPDRDPKDLEARTGIMFRHRAAADVTHAELATEALRGALEDANLQADKLERLILVNSSGADGKVPATANAVEEALSLKGCADAFDLNNACMGFLTALDLAARSIATGYGPIGITVVECLTRHVSAKNPRPYAVFGDAAAAVVLRPAREGEALLGTHLANDGRFRQSVTLGHHCISGNPEEITFLASNKTITEQAIGALESSTEKALERAGMTLDAMDFVLVHQPNGSMLRKIATQLEIPEHKLVPVVDRIGSVGAASIPVSLDVLMRSRNVRPGQHILMVGVGSGLCCGAMVYRT